MTKEPPFPEGAIGRFWLSENDERTAVAGFLRVDGSGVTVDLEGGLSTENGLQDAVVFGRLLESDRRVSLFNTFTTSMRLSEKGCSSSRIHSTLAAFGCNEKSLRAKALAFRLPFCAAWFRERAFEVEFPREGDTVTIEFAAFKSFSYDLLDGYKLERFYAATIPGGGYGEQYEVVRPMGFKVVAPAEVDFDELWGKMRQVQRFFEFLSRNRMPPEELALWRHKESDAWEADIELYLSRSKGAHKVETWDGQLVDSSDIGVRLETMLKEWGRMYEVAPEALSRYFAAYDRDGEDAILHFLWNAAAVEELHKVRTRNRISPGFLGRLQATVARWTSAFDLVPENSVLQQIKDTRHYYAHGAGDLRARAAKEWVLLRQAYFLQALATLELLSELGFPLEKVADVARSRYWIREALGLRMFPS